MKKCSVFACDEPAAKSITFTHGPTRIYCHHHTDDFESERIESMRSLGGETPNTLPERIARGMHLLNERLDVGWVRFINLNELNVGSCEHCVLGQLWQKCAVFNKPSEGVHNAYLAARNALDMSSAEAAYCGFIEQGSFSEEISLNSPLYACSDSELTLEWTKAIKQQKMELENE